MINIYFYYFNFIKYFKGLTKSMTLVKWIKTYFLLIFLAHGLTAVPAFAEKMKIKGIHIITQNTELKHNLEKLLLNYRGRLSSQDTINEVQSEILDYLSTKKYLQAELSRPILTSQQSMLSYEIKNPVRYHFIIRGNQQARLPALYKIINKENLLNHPNFKDIIHKQIISYYQSLAFNGIKVKSSLIKKSKYVYYLKIRLEEGQPFIIKDLKIYGVTDKKSKRYLNLFQFYATSSLKSNYYVKKEFSSVLQKIITHLRKRGFYNAVIYHKNISYKQNKVFIEIIINENTPLKIKQISIKGNNYFNKEVIQNIIQLKPGDYLDIPKLKRNIGKLIQKYFEEGFLQAQIKEKNLVQISRSDKSAVIAVQISEGRRNYIKNIKVQGNKKIDSDFIIHASALTPGKILTYKQIRLSMDFIEDLGLFTRVDIQPEKEDSVIISVQENTFNFLRFRLGFNTEHTLSGKILAEFNTKNVLKDNNSQLLLNMETQPNYRLFKNIFILPANQWMDIFTTPQSVGTYLPYYLSGSYKRYYTLDSRWSTQASYSHSNSIFSFTKLSPLTKDFYLKSSEKVEWLRSHKFSFNLERKFDLNTLFTFKVWEVDLRSSYVQNFLFYPEKTQNQMTFQFEEQTIIAETGLEIQVDRTDNRFFPQKGFHFESTLNYSSPYIGAHKEIHFIRAEAKHTYYIPLLRTIFAQSIHGGAVQRLNSGQVPVARLFILGGAGSLRGYNGEYSGQQAKRIPSTEELKIENAVENKKYSSAYLLVKNEIRIPIYQRLGIILFYDGGLVFLRNKDFNKYYGHSAGFGLYGLTPLGIPAVINVGYRLPRMTKNEKREEGGFHADFSIGFF